MPSQPLHSPIDREIIRASILKSQRNLWQLQLDLNDIILTSHETILQSRKLIAKADEALTRT